MISVLWLQRERSKTTFVHFAAEISPSQPVLCGPINWTPVGPPEVKDDWATWWASLRLQKLKSPDFLLLLFLFLFLFFKNKLDLIFFFCSLVQEPAIVFCKGPGSKCFRLVPVTFHLQTQGQQPWPGGCQLLGQQLAALHTSIASEMPLTDSEAWGDRSMRQMKFCLHQSRKKL